MKHPLFDKWMMEIRTELLGPQVLETHEEVLLRHGKSVWFYFDSGNWDSEIIFSKLGRDNIVILL